MQGGNPVTGFLARVSRIDGTEAWVEARGSLIQWGGQPALQVIIRDITQRRRLEEELRQAQKLEALGQMAGGIAHDFNNLITGILCHVGLLKAAAQADKDTLETASVIEKAARRAADLTSQLLGFARRGKHQDIPVDLGATVDTVVTLVRGTMDPRIAIRKDSPPKPAWVRGDPAQMEQAILNLAVNARDAMAEGGQMTCAVRPVELDEAACAERPARGRARSSPWPCPTPASACRRRSGPTSSSRSSRPSPPARASAWACPWSTALWQTTAAGSTWRAGSAAGPPLRSTCRRRRVRPRKPPRLQNRRRRAPHGFFWWMMRKSSGMPPRGCLPRWGTRSWRSPTGPRPWSITAPSAPAGTWSLSI